MWTGWVMGDTPQTVTTTRAPAVLKSKNPALKYDSKNQSELWTCPLTF